MAAHSNDEPPPVVIPIMTRDGGFVKMSSLTIKKSKVLQDMIAHLNIDLNNPDAFPETIECPVGTVEALEKVNDWCVANHDKPARKPELSRIDLTEEDISFMNMKNELLVQVLMIANFLDIDDLMEIVSQKIANMAKGRSTEYLRKIFMLPDDLTPDEKSALRKKHEWASMPNC